MYCKLCGKHLYETITFTNLFKWNHDMHIDCEKMIRISNDYVVFPLLDTMVHYDYLFAQHFSDADDDFLFTKYIGSLLEKALVEKNRSIIVFTDEIDDVNDLYLVLHLAGKEVIFLSLFYQNMSGNI